MKKSIEKFRIVLADDDLDDCEMFDLALREVNTNFTLEIFNDGKDLLNYLHTIESDLPHLVFLDLNMPFVNGFQTLTEIRRNEKTKDLSVAIYSTSSSEKDIEEALVSGANIYITKPTSFSMLEQILKRVLEMNWQFQKNRFSKDTFYFRL
ncbi:response regulator [Flavobacterium sp. PLA-1-15]|uniref:response regulator n=1 Tax=Flavobacterium sp. PLA-1-15 TaxID=3380533 RepID=UPI003B7883FB